MLTANWCQTSVHASVARQSGSKAGDPGAAEAGAGDAKASLSAKLLTLLAVLPWSPLSQRTAEASVSRAARNMHELPTFTGNHAIHLWEAIHAKQ